MSSGVKSFQILNEKTAARPSTQTSAPVSRAALGRLRVLRSSAQDTKGSIIPSPEVKAARNTSRKNSAATNCPAGMTLNANGKVTKIRPGPSPASRPEPKTMGNMTSPANRAANVSARPIAQAAWGIDISRTNRHHKRAGRRFPPRWRTVTGPRLSICR